MPKKQSKFILYYCIECDCWDYLQLLEKYSDKNMIGLTNGINFDQYGITVLTLILEGIEDSKTQQKYFSYYFDLAIKNNIKINEKILKQGIESCKENVKLKAFEPKIEQYIKTHYP